jgi:hypothetical protein
VTVDTTRVEFLREMTARHPRLLVWKHLDRALRGSGDVDAAAPRSDLPDIGADAFTIGQKTLAATHLIVCTHVADKTLYFFAQPDRLPNLFEFDVCSQPSRGLAPWGSPSRLVPLATVSAQGIRRLRPGAEAVVSLVYHGLSRSGTHRLHDEEFDLVDAGLKEDMLGAREACRTLPPLPARQPLLDLVSQISYGFWKRTAAQRAYAAFALAATAHPPFMARRAAFRLCLATGRECVMSRLARREGRRVPDTGLEQLLIRARAQGHRVIEF